MFSGKRQRRGTTSIPVPDNHVPFYRLLMGPYTPLIRILQVSILTMIISISVCYAGPNCSTSERHTPNAFGLEISPLLTLKLARQEFMEFLECTDCVSNDDETHPYFPCRSYCITYNKRDLGKYYVFSLTRGATFIHLFMYAK